MSDDQDLSQLTAQRENQSKLYVVIRGIDCRNLIGYSNGVVATENKNCFDWSATGSGPYCTGILMPRKDLQVALEHKRVRRRDFRTYKLTHKEMHCHLLHYLSKYLLGL